MRRGWTIGLAAACALAGSAGTGAALHAWWSRSAAVEEPLPAVVVHPLAAEPESGPSWPDGFVGVVLANQTADLASNLPGRLAEVRVDLGDPVRAQDVVAVLEVAVVEHQVGEAWAAVQVARAEQESAGIDLRAAEHQVAQLPGLSSAIPEGEATRIRFAAERAQAALERANAEVRAQTQQFERLRATRSESVITAPFDGQIAARYLDPGALVGPQTPVLRLQATAYRVRFAMPLEALPFVQPGRAVSVELDGERMLTAVVDRVSPSMDAASGLIFAEARIAEDEGAIASGLPARVRVP